MNLEAAVANVLICQNLEEQLVALLFPKRKTDCRSTLFPQCLLGRRVAASDPRW
jgi:hypothetical protein